MELIDAYADHQRLDTPPAPSPSPVPQGETEPHLDPDSGVDSQLDYHISPQADTDLNYHDTHINNTSMENGQSGRYDSDDYHVDDVTVDSDIDNPKTAIEHDTVEDTQDSTSEGERVVVEEKLTNGTGHDRQNNVIKNVDIRVRFIDDFIDE